jgi:chromosome segregation ATPase
MTKKSSRTPKVDLEKSASKTKKVADRTTQPTSKEANITGLPPENSGQDDPILAALTAHEAEIARLHDIILELRNQDVSYRNANLGERPPQAAVSHDDHTVRLQSQIEELNASLQEAWAELETKQAHLQSADSQANSLQARLDAIEARGDQNGAGYVLSLEMVSPPSPASAPADLQELASLRQQV